MGDGRRGLQIEGVGRRVSTVGPCDGAGLAVEVALAGPEQVDSLLLIAPGGSLIADATADLPSFIDAEESALARGDVDGAVEANLAWWVDGPLRGPGGVDPAVRGLVWQMQAGRSKSRPVGAMSRRRNWIPPRSSGSTKSTNPRWCSSAHSISTRSWTRHDG